MNQFFLNIIDSDFLGQKKKKNVEMGIVLGFVLSS